MANLTEISITARKTGFFAVIIVIGLIILRMIIGFSIQIYKASHQPAPAPPDVRFNKIPKPVFSDENRLSSGLTFSLQNIAGRPPDTTASARVYYMPKKLPSFESGDRAKKLAKRLGFIQDPKIESIYYFYTDAGEPLHTLSIDSVHLNFQLIYKYRENPQIFGSEQITSSQQVLDSAKNFIKSNDLFDDSIVNGKITSDLLRYDPASQKLIPANSLSATQAVRINFFREDLDGMKILPPEFNQSYNYLLYAPTPKTNLKNVLELYYTFWPIAFLEYGTYPLSSAQQAYQAMIDGFATVISMGSNTSNSIVIRNIYLAYYDSKQPQLYLQPIFVFEGDNGFVAYYPAITSDWYQ